MFNRKQKNLVFKFSPPKMLSAKLLGGFSKRGFSSGVSRLAKLADPVSPHDLHRAGRHLLMKIN